MARAPRRPLDLYAPDEVRRRFAERGVPLGDKLPKFIQPYANFMRLRAGKRPSTRDVLKAYLITRSSVQRQAVSKATICQAFPEYGDRRVRAFIARKDVRPEDLMAMLLTFAPGQRFLNAAEKGDYDREAATALAATGWPLEMLNLSRNPSLGAAGVAALLAAPTFALRFLDLSRCRLGAATGSRAG